MLRLPTQNERAKAEAEARKTSLYARAKARFDRTFAQGRFPVEPFAEWLHCSAEDPNFVKQVAFDDAMENDLSQYEEGKQ